MRLTLMTLRYILFLLFLQITGAPWSQQNANPNMHFSESVSQTLQPGTNCTLYVCYSDNESDGRASPASCITGKLNIHKIWSKLCVGMKY